MKLIDYEKEDLFRGTVLVVPRDPDPCFLEKEYYFMICEYPYTHKDDQASFALYNVKGYYAGTLQFIFPKEAITKTLHTAAISRTWIIENFKKYIYQQDIEKVEIYEET